MSYMSYATINQNAFDTEDSIQWLLGSMRRVVFPYCLPCLAGDSRVRLFESELEAFHEVLRITDEYINRRNELDEIGAWEFTDDEVESWLRRSRLLDEFRERVATEIDRLSQQGD